MIGTSRIRKLLFWFAGAVLLYTVLGFFILPPIIRHVAIKQMSQLLNRPVSIAQVKLNPYALSTTIRGLMIKDPDGQPFVSWDEVYVNLQASSFFGHAWVFRDISVSRPFVRVQMNRDSTFNFSDLVTKFSTNAAPAKPSLPAKPLMVRVEHFHIEKASASLADLTPKEPFKRTLGPIDVDLTNFGTDPGNKNPYSFTGTTDAGEQISWSGYFYLSPLRSSGTLSLSQFSLNKYAPLYEDLVRFQIRNGVIELKLNYQFEYSADKHVAQVTDASFALHDLEMAAPDQTNDLIALPLFSVLDASFDAENHRAEVGAINICGARLTALRNHENQINVVELATPVATNNVPGGILFLLRSVTNGVALFLNSTNQWSGMVHNVAVTNCAVHLEDEINSRPARLDLDRINLAARNLSNLGGTNMSVDLSLRWNTNGTIRVGTQAALNPLSATVSVDLDELDLSTLDPYLEPKLSLFILDSRAGLHGRIYLKTGADKLPDVSFEGDARLDDFHAVDGQWAEDLLKWDSVRFRGMQARLNPPSVHVHELDLDNVYARVIIESNRTVNLLNALRLTNSIASNTNKTAPATAMAATNSPALALPDFAVEQIVISNAAFNFTDRSIKPTVHLGVEQANGTISGVSSAQLQHADLNLNAKVDGVGPASVVGNINPFNGQYTNHIKVSVSDMDLTPASPYAGKFAGYGIAEGKLSLDLVYDLIGHSVRSKNVITLNQFTFGDHVDSPEATHLPVRLAVAILKDREGKIVLDVPIEGSLDDPKFRISKVVTRALVNILEKVATSPFSLLGAVFSGGGEELGYQDFALGRSDLTVVDRQKLDSMAKGLFQRPSLKLEITGSVDADGDREGLQRAKLDQMILDRKWRSLHQGVGTTNSLDELTLSPAEREAGVKQLYDEMVTAGKITPEMIAANTNLASYAVELTETKSVDTEKGAARLMKPNIITEAPSAKGSAMYHTKLDPPPSPTEAALFLVIPVDSAEFVKLANARAHAVQAYLLQNAKVDGSRLFVKNSSPDDLRETGSRVYLQFE